MKTSCILVAILTAWSVGQALAAELQPSSHSLPDDPAAAWEQVSQVHQALRPPAEWKSRTPSPDEVAKFQEQVRRDMKSFAARAREFAIRWPTNENARDARITVAYALTHAVAAGDSDAEKEIQTFQAEVLGNKALPEDDHVAVVMYAGNAAFMKKLGMRLFTEGMMKFNDEFESNSLEVMRATLNQFPTNGMIFTMLVAVAQRSDDARKRTLAKEIIARPGAPPGVKALATHLLNGTQPYEIGKPVDIQFTALDGRPVDLRKMKGKVTLVEFWSTSCGPCIAEMPTVKAAYEKLHERGFEVVGISLDDKESVLRRFIEEKKLPWPQHFDGKGWENQFALRYGIFAIPTTWLIDKRGNLRSTEARGDLERSVQGLLAEAP